MEFHKELDTAGRLELLNIICEWWENENMPDETLRARVVLIFKKGDTRKLANYMPISLLHSIYNILAAILHSMIEEKLDKHLRKTQYGFRKKRSTSTPVACVRRILDKAEATKSAVCLTFLDWEKAFDKIDQNKLFEALKRIGISNKFIGTIKSLYNNPQFRVKVEGKESEWKKQETGIRQGCPLSPYLFIIVMTILFKDVHSEINLSRGKLPGIDFTELLYADDTAIVTNNANAMNKMLASIEKQADYYGLKFNKTKRG